MKIAASLILVLALSVAASTAGAAPYDSWQHSGSVYILTTPEGANLPASVSEQNFPLLMRLDKDSFDFSTAQANGADIRCSTIDGQPLRYEIDHWDSEQGMASIWARIPEIKGNQRQEIKLFWGKPDAASESSGAAVFNESNGYLSVWHMNEPLKDAVGRLESKNSGTTLCAGIVGQARHFAGGQGIFCGDAIANFPTGSSSHTTEAWFRAEKPNGTLVGWGNEQAQGKVVMQFRSPPHVQMDCYFSDGNVTGRDTIPMADWVHVAHTYRKGEARLYVNGLLDVASATPASPLAIKSPARMWIGGWYNNYDFVGAVDEVRISKVARSAAWVKLEYENQKPLQALVGPLVQTGDAFSVSPAQATVNEGQSVTFSAQAGSAQKVTWTLKRNGRENLVASDSFKFKFDAGRVTGDQSATLKFKAIYADTVKTLEIPLTVKEAIPDPAFTLHAPSRWDGRSIIELVPQIANMAEVRANGAGALRYHWSISNIAVIKEAKHDRLILHRAQNSGKLTVTATLDNGGQPVAQTVEMVVTEPPKDPWIARTPGKNEKPEENEFFARDDKNEGTLIYNGSLSDVADSVFLRIAADERPYFAENHKLGSDRSYAFSVKLKPGLIRYKAEFGTKTGQRETLLNTVNNLVCGDAFLIDGQSNAEATSWGDETYSFSSPWIRSFGSMDGSPDGARSKLWSAAVARAPGGKAQVGYWGMELARRLVEDQKMPICILNGAVGGTRIDQHQRSDSDPEDVSTIYGRLLWRVRQARLTHGIRGVLWHQGENDQGADGPTGRFGWETYRQYFIDMAGAWKQDYPNIEHYYVFQIWPKSCAMGIDGSDNRLREVQRNLPTAFSRLSVMSTLGIDPPGGCHYPPAGYAEFARLICPLLERDHYGRVFTASITPPNLERAYFTNDKRDEIVLEFDQPVKWSNPLSNQFYLADQKGKVASGTASGNLITLRLTAPSTARTITYLDSAAWSQKTLLRGENGIAALTFCDVPISPSRPSR